MVMRRVLTAAVAIPAVFFILLKCSPGTILVVVLFVAALALKEYYDMALSRTDVWGKGLGMLMGCCMLV
ncbi:MAG: hypothetical protein WCQ99_06260, partial [Pseudomonadota bacterium]